MQGKICIIAAHTYNLYCAVPYLQCRGIKSIPALATALALDSVLLFHAGFFSAATELRGFMRILGRPPAVSSQYWLFNNSTDLRDLVVSTVNAFPCSDGFQSMAGCSSELNLTGGGGPYHVRSTS